MASSTHLESVEIRTFRGFSHLAVPRLGRLNLLVGRNSVGKTSFLEAVGIYASGEHALARVRTLLEEREEIARAVTDSEDSFPQWSLDRVFHQGTGELASEFSIGPIGSPASTLTVERGGIRYIESADGTSRTREVVSVSEIGTLDPDVLAALIVRIGTSIERAHPLDQISRLDTRYFSIQQREYAQQAIGQYLPARGLVGNEPGELWDRIVLTDREDEVISALQVIDPDIVRVSMIEHPRGRRGERIALVKRKGVSQPESLKSLGDGMSRLFELALTMTNCANNVALIDEIENGVHHSAQVELWRLVSRVAERLNVQLFATTHSLDSIRAFQRATCAPDSSCSLIRLERDHNVVTAEVFGGADLATVAGEEIEVR